MKNLRRVVWSKGMFLTPQQFQTQDAFFSEDLQFRFASSLYANWGVTELSINQAALANDQFSVVRCSGVLPDGLTFEFPDTDAAPPGRSVREHFDSHQDSLDVYLSIPEERSGGKNITHIPAASLEEAASAVITRYSAENVNIADANTGDDEKIVQVGRKNFRILFGDEVLDGSTALRIARIVRDETAQLALDPEFIAPCLSAHSSEYLVGLVRRQIELLRNKRAALAGGRRQKGLDLADFSTSDVANFWLLHTVNSYAPELHHIWKKRKSHPEPLFVAMLRLAGALSTFILDKPVPELPDYDHDNLGPCFTALDNHIRNLLETVIPSKCISVPLRPTAHKHTWTGSITDDQYFRDSQFFLAMSAKIGISELIDKTPKLVKIASPDDISQIVKWALPGIGLQHTPAPPSAIAFRLDNQYFSLDQKNAIWEGVQRSRSISLFVPGEITDAKIELLIVLK